MSNDDAPTPPSWFSYAVFRDECRRTAEALEHVAIVSRKRIDLLNFPRAERAERIAARLRELAMLFAGWDELSPEDVAVERDTLVPELTRLLREAVGMLEKLPSAGTLGPVRRR